MYRSLDRRRRERGRGRRRWPRSRAGGCLLWIVLLIVLLIVLSVLFGGFQKGTKSGSFGPLCATCTSAAVAAAGGPHGTVAVQMLRTFAA